jgi:aminopeptidase N
MSAPDSGETAPPQPIRLADYRVPAFLIDTVELIFDLGETATRVRSRIAVRRNPDSLERDAPLRLDGEALELIAVALDDEPLGANRYRLEPELLVIPEVPDAFTLDIETRIHPQRNTALSGLYTSGGNFCTQCEAEGFRRITWFLDRPDVMARYTTTIVADRQRYPVLLSNGNPVDRGESTDGRHWVKWEDPHPKPSYLFALVAGDLVAVQDRFTTRSGRDVALGIWVRRGDEDKCGHAMASLEAAMRWDEIAFGREYDLDIFNIVAVSDFNMGAMENKGLNIFNTKYVLAKPATATDTDYQGIESVISHEYFHNWTGNRVTCRDWFQLSLKEGLTVFRDQEFSADQGSAAVRRIADVRRLRASQFPEDAGPLAHPVRPDSYIEIDNFYTATVYNKGAEVVRMIRTLLGAEAFRRGMDLYFERHDNRAVTVEDFVGAMEAASGLDLGHFMRWYVQAGTPELRIEDSYDAAAGCYELTIIQSTPPTPGQSLKEPLTFPLAMGLLGPDGTDLPARLDGETAPRGGTRVLTVSDTRQSFRFDGVAAPPVPSLLRGYSAPMKLEDVPPERLSFLARHDSDPFVRWDAGQLVASQTLLRLVDAIRRGETPTLEPALVDAVAHNLEGAGEDPAFAAEAIALPGEAGLADLMDTIDVEAIHEARRFARAGIGRALAPLLHAAYERLTETGEYRTDGAAMGRRALRNACLGYLVMGEVPGAMSLAKAQFDLGANMTDVLSALALLNEHDSAERDAALEDFYARWSAEELVVDKWFSLQAMAPLPGTIEAVERLTRHPAFDIRNPNRVRALVGSFSQANQLHFHDRSGRGYRFLADQVIRLDPLNASIASRSIQPLGQWRRQDAARQSLMRAELERVLAVPGLSKNTYEVASKSLI